MALSTSPNICSGVLIGFLDRPEEVLPMEGHCFDVDDYCATDYSLHISDSIPTR